MQLIRFYIILIIIILPFMVKGQHIFNAFQSELKKADRLMKEQGYASALELYLRIAENDKSGYSKLKVAQCLKALSRLPEAEKWYEKALSGYTAVESPDHLDYAESLLANGKYDLARKTFQQYQFKYGKDSMVTRKIESIATIKSFLEDSLSYQVQELTINSEESDFSPAFYNDGMVFLSSRKKGTLIKNIDAATNTQFYDMYFLKLQDNSYSGLVDFDKINSNYHGGPLTFFDKGRKVIYTSNSQEAGITSNSSINQLMLIYAEKDSSGRFNKNVKALPFNSSNYSVSHCTFSEKSNTLYFVSNKPGGYGGTDIYKSNFTNGQWSSPQNLGPEINTYGNEMFPFIYKDKVLCFASNGHPGLGGLDIFYTILDSIRYYPVQNVGYPLNTRADDFGAIISKDGSHGYFCSNRYKSDDIFYFSLNKILLHGVVLDKLGEKKMANVVVKVFEEGEIKFEKQTDAQGNFNFELKPGKTYVIQAIQEGYRDSKTTINTPATNSRIVYFDKNILLERRNKAFVKGIVRDPTGAPVEGCNVKILNSYGQNYNLLTDKKGIIKCEVDSDVENFFIAEKDKYWGSYTLEPESRAKGSVVLNVEIEVGSVRTYDINGYLKSENTGEPLEGYVVQVMSNSTGENLYICTGKDGRFNFKAISNFTYDVIIQFGKRKTQLKSFAPKADYNFEIFWSEN